MGTFTFDFSGILHLAETPLYFYFSSVSNAGLLFSCKQIKLQLA